MLLVKLKSTNKRIQIDSHLISCRKLNSKWIKDINIEPGAVNMIIAKVFNSFEFIGTGEGFLNRKLLSQVLRSIMSR